MRLKDYITDHRILTDGAMGTYFDIVEESELLCSEEANITDPEIILNIHKAYIDKGASLIRSNTFMANKDVLEKIRLKNRAFRYISLKDFVKAGYGLAKEAETSARDQGRVCFAAADIGPIGENAETDREDLILQYQEICDAFLEEDCDLFVFETFPDEYYVLKMAEYIRSKNPEAFILGQFAFMPTGHGSTGFHYSNVLDRAIQSKLLDAVGLNCGIGAFHMDNFLSKYLEENDIPDDVILSALPNCGYPQIVRGKAIYSDSVAYFSSKLKEIANLGVRILGGCCGTSPDYIGAISKWIGDESLNIPQRILVGPDRKKKEETVKTVNRFYEKIQKGEKVFAVELDPPFDADCSKLMDGAKALLDTKADIITLADSPLARSRADSLILASKIKREVGIDVMPHLTSRDRNRIAIRGGILGAYINDVRNYLFITGDPVARSERDNTKSVFDFNSIQCMRYARHMNESLFAKDPIFYGGALNQDGANIEIIAKRMKKKMEEGCSYFLSQPVYSQESVDRLRMLKELTGAKLLVGILPLISHRNALFMKNEMPGIYVSDEVVALYKEDANRTEWEKVAVDYSIKMMNKCEEIGAGYYMMTPFNRVHVIKNIMKNY